MRGKERLKMKKLIFILTMLLLCQQALALDSVTVDIRVTVQHPPDIGGFMPADGTVTTEGDTLLISVTATDPNINDALQYQYYINGEVKAPWSAENTFSYKLTVGDVGLNTIKAEVTDTKETVATQEVEIFVFRGSPGLPDSE